MSASTKRRTGGRNSAWRFLYRAQAALAEADVDAVCATAAGLAVPRLGACMASGLGG
jgi:hypothetical protein